MTNGTEPSEARKVVTVLFTDVVGSTVLAEELDVESLGRMMTRYFDEMKTIVERHGGRVEKFIGDALMAVFGIPRLHEDDALRAVRAALEMHHALRGLNDEFERSWGVLLAVRTGVNTGEVIAGDQGRDLGFVLGDAANTAARLEQAAPPGEILIGATTYDLVRDAVVVESVGALSLKGKREPMPAWQLLDVGEGAPGHTRRLDSPLVGRARDLDTLETIFDRTAETRGCELVTLVGSAGVGKSRLTLEVLKHVGDRAIVIEGRCLPYGEGITFWPIVEVLRDAAGIREVEGIDSARSKILALLAASRDRDDIGDRLAALLGPSEAMPSIQETFWAVRRLFEQLAKRRPLVVVFDDIHWGEATFLDLIGYLAESIRGAPILILCMTRPELLEARPGWAADKENVTLITLHPLTGSETEGLISNLVGGADLAKKARERIAEVAEGNPLFVEETLQMLVDEGLLVPAEGRWTVRGNLADISIPPTIHALLSARLDRLEAEERGTIERASIIGRVFWWGAVVELSPEDLRPRLSNHMRALTQKELVRADESSPWQGDAYRFTHMLVRDAAYNGTPKSVRAELHERIADWVEDKTRDQAGEYEEIIGYHLEQAYRSLLDLGPATERIETLGRRAARPLASAGRRAFSRGDMPAAVQLLSRAASLHLASDPERLDLLPLLAFALLETGDFTKLQGAAAEVTDAAAASPEPALRAHALILGMWVKLFTNPEGWAEEALREATRAIEIFREVGDERGLSKGWALLGLVHVVTARFEPAEKAWEAAASHAHQAGDRRDELESLSWVPLCVWCGPTGVERGLERCQEVLERAGGDKKTVSTALFVRAAFEAGLGRFGEARGLIARAKGFLEEAALTVWMAGPLAQFAGLVELWAGDPVEAERELRWGYQQLGEIGEMAWLSTVVAILADALRVQGRHEEAEGLTKESEASSGEEDAYSQVLWRSVRAEILAGRGSLSDAERLALESVAIASETDFLLLQGWALSSLAEVLRSANRAREAEAALREAVSLFERKGNVVLAKRARALLEPV